ncbi:isoprenylcysteine carboxylmethyltransferase family protein [Candidatus Thorarchaeota archaeon]|jgi:protein-S-isoprenylcysteine O-methyltransferase Ste14|nr:MAG: isoprenylcysteine carboxylmethyltransferase family protein [Candidatus Thorarchaeota archaeon]
MFNLVVFEVAHMIQYVIIILGATLFGGLHSGISALRVKNRIIDKYGKNGYSRIFTITSVVSFMVAFLSMWFWDWLYFLGNFTLETILLLGVGIMMIAAGGYLAMLASRVISVSTVADMRTDRLPELITGGLYARIRHPLYLATILVFGGLGVMYPFPRVIVFSLAMILYTIIGAVLEERKLIAHYGQEYIDYKKEAGFILPRFGQPKAT